MCFGVVLETIFSGEDVKVEIVLTAARVVVSSIRRRTIENMLLMSVFGG